MARPETTVQTVLRFIRQHRLVARGEKLVVAVSGGPDSVCLLHVLTQLQGELGIELHVAHLDHQLRDAAAAADAEYVTDLARRLGLPVTVASRDVRAYRAQHRVSLEEAAREVRYAFLAEVAQETGAAKAVVGHTADDHIETILMHL
ncbi:MAG: tRNA lysidine(34) synthetase TilS, partial [Chloroflexota bacterium]